MKEIKFRGRRTDNGEWVYGSLLDGDIIVRGQVDVDEDYIGLSEWFSVEPKTVGQYAGLKDKNGKDIYDGDIVKHMVDFGPGGEHECTSEIIITPFGIGIQHWIFEEDGYLPEVIGNIHDHPHLEGHCKIMSISEIIIILCGIAYIYGVIKGDIRWRKDD